MEDNTFFSTTDFIDLTDVNHERKRTHPFNPLFYLWSKQKKRINLIYLKL